MSGAIDRRLARALARWQHAAGPFWPYVGAAPFLGPSAPRGSARPPRVPRRLVAAIADLAADEPTVVVVDLPPATTLPATPALVARGFYLLPALERWAEAPALVPSERLLALLIAVAERTRRPRQARGLVLLLDGDRAGPRRAPRNPRAFDNRYVYAARPFPPPGLLLRHGIRRVRWLAPGGVATDLEPYAALLAESGLSPVVETALGAPRPATGPGRTAGAGSLVENLSNHDHPPSSRSAQAEGDGRGPPEPGQSGPGDVRVLAQDPAAVDANRYRRFVRRAELEGLLPDNVVEGEPYLALNALVLSPADHLLLQRLTETFASAFHRAGQRLAADVPGLVELGFPWVAAELLAAEPARLPLAGRFDFARDEAGHWWLLEFNADTPSGVREALVADRLVHRLLAADWLERPSACLGDALVEAFRAALAGQAGGALGLATTASMLEDLAQMAFTRALLGRPLEDLSISVVLGDAANLRSTRRGLALGGQRIDALYRYVPFEGMLGTPAFAAIYDAVAAGQLNLLNGLYGLLLQHKGVLAWLWAHRDDPALSPAERQAIREHLPPTWMIDALPPTEAQSSLVAKQVFGREGEEVFFGEDLAPEVWRDLARRRTYVAQRRVRVAAVRGVVPTSLGPARARGYPSVGCFAVAGRWAGYYTRFGAKIVTARAKFLATLVDSRGAG